MARRRTRTKSTSLPTQPELKVVPEVTAIKPEQSVAAATLTLETTPPTVVKPSLTKARKVLKHPATAVINENSNKAEIVTGSKEYADYCEKMVNKFKDQRDLAFIAALAALLIGSVL